MELASTKEMPFGASSAVACFPSEAKDAAARATRTNRILLVAHHLTHFAARESGPGLKRDHGGVVDLRAQTGAARVEARRPARSRMS
jgi:hypothetical protein